MKRVLFYLFYDEQGIVDDYIPYKLSKLREHVDTIFVVSNSPLDAKARDKLEAVADIVHERENVGFDVWGYKDAMETFGEMRLEEYDELILMNYTFFAPIFPFSETFNAMDAVECDFWGITAHKEVVPNPFTHEGVLPLHLNSHWISVRRKMFTSPEFRAYWANIPPINSYVESILAHESRFTEYFTKLGFKCKVAFPPEDYPTEYTAFQSVEMMLKDRCPILKRRLFFQDPLFLEQNAMVLRDSMKLIEERSDYDLSLVWKNIVRKAQPRVLHTNLDLLEVLPDRAEDAPPTRTPRIAVLAHLYYDDMVDEVMGYVTNIPYPYDLYVTTNTDEKKKRIEQALARYALPFVDVRVTEQNRGRDMGSLFITLRDVLLSGKYDYACRVHSKKSPQNSYNMGLLFKRHMFDNLLCSKGYVANVIAMFEQDPLLGMVMPPVVQIAYPTLGHSWFANREPARHWAGILGIKVNFDDSTPMAPYGTMFWFRPEAIGEITAHEFEWTDFAEEPNHVDGSLAHVLERLLGYSVMSRGYHLRCVFNRYWAAINYTKLEYKLQRLAALLPNGNILNQVFWIERAQAVISNLGSVTMKDPWSDAAIWLQESRQLRDKLAEQGAAGDFGRQMEWVSEAKQLRDKLVEQGATGDFDQQLEWVSESKQARETALRLSMPSVRMSLDMLLFAVKRSFAYRFPGATKALRPVYRFLFGAPRSD